MLRFKCKGTNKINFKASPTGSTSELLFALYYRSPYYTLNNGHGDKNFEKEFKLEKWYKVGF